MPRPKYATAKARRKLTTWIAQRIPIAPADAPITVGAALEHLRAEGIPAHRATLYEHGLHTLIADGARRQREEGGGRRSVSERQAYEKDLARLRAGHVALEAKNRALLGEIATIVWNARRLGISDAELRLPMPSPDRSQSRAGRRK